MARAEPGTRTQQAAGLLGSARGLLRTLLGILQTRLELLGNEVQEEALRLRRLALFSFVVVFFFALAVIFGTLFCIMVFWERYGVAAIGFFAVLYALAGLALLLWLRRTVLSQSRLFETSLAELAKDRERLNP